MVNEFEANLATPLIVLDTMIVVSAIIGHRRATDARVLEAIETGMIRLALSDAGLRELQEVIARPFLTEHIPDIGRVFRVAMVLGLMGQLYRPERFDWTTLTDEKDWWLLDLAFCSNADCIVTRDLKVLRAANKLGFRAVEPPVFLENLS